MTLLLGTLTTTGTVITADGFSIKNENLSIKNKKQDRRAIGRTTLQKIFTDEERLAIAHCGENLVEERAIANILRELLTQVPAGTAIRDLAVDIQQNIPIPDGGFWVAGFDADTEFPVMYEVVSVNKHVGPPIELGRCVIHRCGAGAKFVNAQQDLGTDDLQEIAAYHDSLYDTALENQGNRQKVFGGHKHQLVLGRKCPWRIPPQECGLGFKEILDDLGVLPTAAPDLGGMDPQAAIEAKWCEFRQWCSKQLGCKRTLMYGGIEERFVKRGLWGPIKTYADTALAMFDEGDKCEQREVAPQDAFLFAGYLEWVKTQIGIVIQSSLV